MTEYLAQVEHQRDQARRDLHSAEDELAQLRPLPAQLASAKAELAALHEGEEPYEDERLAASPAQWIWRWNRATPARRLEVAEQMRSLSDAVDRCTFGLHTARLAELHELRQDWTAKVAELATAEAERDRFAAGVPLICADDRHEAKVRGLEAQIAAFRTLAEGWEREHPRFGIGAQVLAALDGPADARHTTPSTATETTR